VLSILVQQVKQLNIDKKDHPFKIHIVVMTKDDAAEVCDALSDESISCLMLTIDVSDADMQARAAHDQIESNKEYVREQLTKMKEQCVVCKALTNM